MLGGRFAPPLPHFASAVELRIKDANQKFLTIAGGFFRGANVELNPRYAMQQPDDPARQAFGIGNAITGQPLAQIPRLADIQHALGCAAHEIRS